MSNGTRLLNARSVRALDIGLVAWIAVWAVLGVLIWHDITAQSSLSASVIKAGGAVRQTGDALDVLASVPFVGDSVSEFAGRIQRIGDEVQASGEESRDGIERIALIAGIGVGVLPAALLLVVYLPLRLAWRRDVASVSAALRGAQGGPAFEEYLARRALDTLTWGQLCVLSADPWGDVGRGQTRAFADAELARLGLRRSA